MNSHTIIRESARLTHTHVCWVPTQHMLAGSLTKDVLEPIDFLRVCLKESVYHISPESVVLGKQAFEKERKRLHKAIL